MATKASIKDPPRSKRRVAIDVPPDLHDDIAVLAIRRKLNISDIYVTAAKRYMEAEATV